MIDKIYKKVKEDEKKSAQYYNESLGIDDIDYSEIISKTNYDLITILTKTGLLKEDSKNLEIVDEFYEYLFKLGIKIGIDQGKKWFIDNLKEDKVDFNKIMNIDPEILIQHDTKPSYVQDMINSLEKEGRG